MKANSVVLLEANNAVLTQLKEAFTALEGFNVLYAGDDGDEGIKQILGLKPDLVVVGMFLKGTDGCGVIRAAKKTWAHTKIIATGLPNDSLIEEAMGGGDVKLMAGVGALIGWEGVITTVILGSLFGLIYAIFLMIFKGKNKSDAIPFGPFLSLGALINLFYLIKPSMMVIEL